MHRRTVLVLAGLTVGSSAAIAPMASAAVPVDVYMHGSTHMASFSSKAECEPHASAMAQAVTRNVRAGYRFVPVLPGPGMSLNQANSRNCFPLAGGRWTYLTVYVAPTGKPLNKFDVRVPTSQASWSSNVTIDIQSYYVVYDNENRSTSQWTLAACQALFNKRLNAIRANTHTAPARLLPCEVNGDRIISQMRYFTSTPVGLFGEDKGLTEIATNAHASLEWYYDWSTTHHS